MQENLNDPKSTPSRPPYTPSTQWADGGYPWRHRKALQRAIEIKGDPWLTWEGDAAQRLTEASKKIIEGDALLVILGPRGTGKTQAAVELSLKMDLHESAIDQYRVSTHMYFPLGEMMNKEKRSWDDKMVESPLKKAKTCGLLVLDEIQESTGSEWERQTLTLLVDDRYRNMKRTILIGNLTAGESGLGAFLSASIKSRIQETGSVIEMTGKRYR